MRNLSSAKAPRGIADGADDARMQIFSAAHKVEDFAADRIEHHAVDGEIASGDVFAGVLAEADFIGMASVGVAEIAAEGRNFYGVGL